MKRETTNLIRFVLEELLPPIVRDSGLFRMAAKLAWGDHIDRLADFRARATELTPEEYYTLYRDHPRVQHGTDNSEACIARIIADCRAADSICDVGCGTGELLRRIQTAGTAAKRLTGVDFAVDDAKALPGIEYVASRIEKLPFADGAFDTVICTHTLEHILDFAQSIAELRRVAQRQLIVVVPREREYKYTFNPHFNFFPYAHSLLKVMHPSPRDHQVAIIGRDIYYREVRA
jgi:2-polyprenyl-3-methyl-5-hydroxy-6-metoxy-1,4-benzoquinol methylase